MLIKIESAEESDAAILTAITFDGKAFWGFTKKQLDDWSELLTITPDYISANQVFKLIYESGIIGYYSFLLKDKAEIKLDNFFLFQNFIGQGFGRFMMEDLLQRSKDLKVKTITLESEPKAEHFYKKFGYSTYDQIESVIKNRLLPKMRLNL